MVETLSNLFGGSFSLKEGHFLFIDQSLGKPDLKTEIRSFNLEVSNVSYGNPVPFSTEREAG